MRKRIGLIPARGGSKGIPNKNIYMVNGKPLIAYSIEAGLEAKKRGMLDCIVVSTDDEKIADISREYGAEVPFIRPKELASDTSKSVDCMIHAIQYYENIGIEFDDIVLLQPTSPLRLAEDIVKAVGIYETEATDSLVSCYREDSINEYNVYYLDNNIGNPLREEHNLGKRRQEIPTLYVRNGAIFITDVQYMLERKLVIGNRPAIYVMPKIRSVNIDTLYDMHQAEWILKNVEDLSRED
jgi:CMP-N-acetylneuraminic acid synthetase